MFPSPFVREITISLAASWRSLVAADIIYKTVAFVLLTPLFTAMFQCLILFSGQSVLADVDIAKFFAGPLGWLCAIALGAVWLGIMAMEQASLLAILAARTKGQKLVSIDSLRFAARNSVGILRLTGRLIGLSLLAAAPFLLLAAGVYYWLLSDYDINYYLNEHPIEFRIATAIGGLLAAGLLGILLRFYSNWFLALPLVLFDKISPFKSLQTSRRLAFGYRRKILIWLVTWLFVVFAMNLLITATVGAAGRMLIPSSIGSLVILATRVGMMLLILVASGLVLNLVSTIVFAGILFHGYTHINPHSAAAIDATNLNERQSSYSIFTRPRLAAVGVIGVLVAALIGYWSLDTLPLEDDLQIMAHRGASKVAPENSMAAFRQAIEDGADCIEIDVQETADGEVVVLHDSDFMKLAGNPLKIWNARREDIANIDIGSRFDPQFSDERVPTLADVLQLCKDKIGVNIELKYYGHDQQLEQRVVEIVETADMADQIMIMSLKPQGIAKIKALRPEWKCGLLLSVYVGRLQKIPADFLAVNAKFATNSFVTRAHKANKLVFVWTVNDAATMSQMISRRIDGILTDRPELAREVLRQRSEMSLSERLLAEISILFNQPQTPVEQ